MADLKDKLKNPTKPSLSQVLSSPMLESSAPEIKDAQQKEQDAQLVLPAIETSAQDLASPAVAMQAATEANQLAGELALPKSARMVVNKNLKAIQDSLKELDQKELSAEERAGWAEMAQVAGQALTQLGAGMYGLKHNTDLSGIKFNKVDWQKQLDRTLDRLARQRAELLRMREAGQATLAEMEKEEGRKAEKAGDVAREERARKERLAFERERLAAKEEPKKDEMQEVVDKEFAKNLGKLVADPAQRAAAGRNIEQLDNAIQRIEEPGEVTGGLLQRLPNWMRSFVDQESLDIQETIEQVVQQDLRQTLGAQFTEKEGERLIKRAYNPNLPEKENLRRLKRLSEQMKQAKANQDEAIEYFKKNKTLDGFDRKLFKSADDFTFDAPASEPAAESKTVRVRNPEGQVGSIPRENLDKALKAGFKVVE